MPNSLNEAPVSLVLARLFADAEEQLLRLGASPLASANAADLASPSMRQTPFERYSERKDLYMTVDRPFADLLYGWIRSSRASTVVEFGTSFGISTIFLAAAVRDHGGGRVVTTEFIPEKVEVARKNLAEAGLVDLVEFRIGDALESLKEPLPGPVDFVFLDGEKSMYLDVLKTLEPQLAPGCVIVSDNTDHEGVEEFLAYLRDPQNGYVSTAVLTLGGPKHDSGHEISVRV